MVGRSMLYYFGLFVFVLILTSILKRISYNNKTVTLKYSNIKVGISLDFIWIILLSLPFIFLATYRDLSIGTDTNGVYRYIYYEGYAVDDWKSTIYEGLYLSFVKFLYWIKQDYRFLLFATSCIVCIGFIAFFLEKRNKLNPTMTITCFFVWIYCFSLNGQRQALALTLCLLVLICLEKRKPILAGIFIIIAAFVHISSLVMFIYYIPYLFGNNVKIRDKIPYLFFLGPVGLPIIISIVKHLPFFSRLAGYVANFSLNGVSTKFLLFPLLMAPLVGIYWNKFVELDNFNYMHLCGYIFIFSAVLLSGYATYAFRMMYYFVPSEIIILGQLDKCCKNKTNKIMVNTYILLGLIVSFFVVYVFHDTDSIYPYILEKWN